MRCHYDKKEPKIYKSIRGKWKVRFFDEHQNAYRDKVVATKTEAENLRRAIWRGDNLSLWLPEHNGVQISKLTFADLAEKWMDHGKDIRRLSGSCLMNYRTHLKNHILPVFGNQHVNKLTIDDIENLARELNKKKPQTRSYKAIRKNRWEDEAYIESDVLSLAYQREILTVACMITNWGSSRRPAYLSSNPFEGFKLPATPETLYDYWSQEDENKFFDWIEAGGHYEHETTRYHHRGHQKLVIKLQVRQPDELRDIITMALRTGMRLGEIGALRNMDVDLGAGFIIVRGSYSRKEGVRKNTTKNKKARRVEINEDVRNILYKRRFVEQTQPLFNIHMNCIKNFPRTCRWAGVKEIHFHSLRHTCLTYLANGYGMDRPLPLPKVQQIAGHNDIKTTMRYVHNDIIKDTASLQWSREDRKRNALPKEPIEPVTAISQTSEEPQKVISIKKGLRLISSR